MKNDDQQYVDDNQHVYNQQPVSIKQQSYKEGTIVVSLVMNKWKLKLCDYDYAFNKDSPCIGNYFLF